jgi:hypothetical protein
MPHQPNHRAQAAALMADLKPKLEKLVSVPEIMSMISIA